eukprot:1068841-Pelagomonas_calceolata.AAC.1
MEEMVSVPSRAGAETCTCIDNIKSYFCEERLRATLGAASFGAAILHSLPMRISQHTNLALA